MPPQPTATGWASTLLRGSSPARVIGVIGLLGLLLVTLSTIFIMWEQRRRLFDSAEKEAQNSAFFLADHAARLFEVADVALLSTRVSVTGLDWDRIEQSEALWNQLRTVRQTLPHMEDIWLNDETGRLRLTTFGFPTPASNAADRDMFKAHLAPGDQLFVGAPILGRVTGRQTFLLSRRLEEPDGRFRGVVSVTADLQYFTSYWQRLRLPFRERVTLMRESDLSILAQHPPVQGRTFDASVVRAKLQAAPESGELTDYLEGSRERVGFYHRVGGEPLYILASYAPSAVNAVWMRQIGAYAGFAGVALLALTGLTFLSFRQVRAEAATLATLERHVQERTVDLRAANDKLALLFQEVNHRIKNSLQIVASMIQLQLRDLADPQSGKVLTDALSRLHAVGRVHEQLYKSDVLGSVHADSYLRPLCTDLVDSLASDGGCSVDVDLDPIEISLDRAVPLALIVSELMTNAVKYACTADKPCALRVSLKRLPDGLARLEVADNGPGLPADFRPERTGSLGMRVIASLARQLDGKVAFASDPGGTRASLDLRPI